MSTLAVGEFQRDVCGNSIRVDFLKFDERVFLDVRLWAVGGDGEYTATRKGATIPVSRIGDFLGLVTQAHALAVEHGLVEESVDAMETPGASCPDPRGATE